MPRKKSILEMKKWERIGNSLQFKVIRATVIGAVILGIVMLAIGLGLYTLSLSNQYVTEAFGLTRSTAALVDDVADVRQMTYDVIERYYALSEEEMAQTGTPGYREIFSDLMDAEDYRRLTYFLEKQREASDVTFLYVARFDESTGKLVYICDPDASAQTGCYPGDWEDVIPREYEKFTSWDGQGKLYDLSNTKRYGLMYTCGMPIRDDKGEIVCHIMADITLKDIGRRIRNFVLQYTIALLAVMIALSFFLSKRMKKTVVEPINEIAEAAKNYTEDRQMGNGESDHFSKLDIRTGDEIENLSLVMANMERSLTEYEQNLTKVTAEKERIGTELSLASRIQSSMLPSTFPPFPDRKEFDIYATMNPAKEVGGDFYDFFLIDDTHLGLVIADVSGKGVPAALFMMASKILIANMTRQGHSPAQVLERVNNAICSNNREEMFVTVWLGILEIPTGKMTAANAGHEYPVLMQPGGGFELIKDRHGLVLGGMEGVKYKEYEIILKPGSKLFVYTDGVPEATDRENNLFGTERMLDALNEDRQAHPADVLEAVALAVDHFVEDAEQFDDLTMLCLEYMGPQEVKE